MVGVTAARADESATHEQVQVIEVAREGAASLQTLAATPDGKVIALVSLSRYSVPSPGGEKSSSKVLVLDEAGKELNRWALEFNGQSIGSGPDGSVYVAGEGKLAKYSVEGKLLASAEVPHLLEVLRDQEKLRQQAEEQIKSQQASIEESKKEFEDQAKALRDKGEENLSDVEKQQLKALEVNIRAYEQYLKNRPQQSVESAMASLTTRLRTINAIAATDKDVFIACGELKGYGYAIWRMGLDFKNPTQVLGKLGGCCGQMDVQARGDQLFVAENTRHRVGRYDLTGKLVSHFGKRERESEGECFGGCCNPMNCRIGAGGEIYTAESEGVVKKFNAQGQFVALIGTVKLSGGCKNVAVAASPKGDRVYFCDLPGSRIIVLAQKTATAAGSN
jgi:hypothetical protein